MFPPIHHEYYFDPNNDVLVYDEVLSDEEMDDSSPSLSELARTTYSTENEMDNMADTD